MTVASQVKQTIATLHGVQGTLRLYSLQSQSEDEISTYKEALETTNEVLYDLEKRLKYLEYEEPQYKGF